MVSTVIAEVSFIFSRTMLTIGLIPGFFDFPQSASTVSISRSACDSFSTVGNVCGIFGVINVAAGFVAMRSCSSAQAKKLRTATVLRAMELRA